MPKQRPDTLPLLLYWVYCIALLVIGLVLQMTIPVVKLYSLVVHFATFQLIMGGAVVLALYDKKRLQTYLKENHPQLWEQPEPLMHFMQSEQQFDDPMLSKHRAYRKWVAYSPFIIIVLWGFFTVVGEIWL